MSHEQICHRILLDIGNSLDLGHMLSKSLSTYMRELSCSMGAVLLTDYNKRRKLSFTPAFAMPRTIQKKPSFRTLVDTLLHRSSAMQDIEIFPAAGDEGTYYVMSIGDAGLLILFKRAALLPQPLLNALKPINIKLGNACRACQHNMAFHDSSIRFQEMANMLPGIIIEFDNACAVTFYNRRTQDIFKQVDSSEFSPESVFDFFSRESEYRIRELLARIQDGEEMVSADLVMINSRKEQFMVNLILSPMRMQGVLSGYRGIAIDITNRVALENNLKLRDRILHALTLATNQLMREKLFDEAVHGTLRLIGSALDVDHAYYAKLSDNDPGRSSGRDREYPITVVSEWRGERVADDFSISAMKAMPGSDCQDCLQQLLAGNLCPVRNETAHSASLRALYHDFGIHATLLIPIMVKHQIWAVIGCNVFGTERSWSPTELELLKLFAVSVSEIMERRTIEEQNRQLYENIMDELETANRIQTYMLPAWCSTVGRFIITANYQPWEKVGGDLFDMIELSDTQYIAYIADISGHGVQAALVMTAVKSVTRMVVHEHAGAVDLAAVMTRLNALLSRELFRENYMTMSLVLINLETGTVSCLNAGHPPLLQLSEDSHRLLNSDGGIPLGWLDDYQYHPEMVETVPFGRSDTICLYTDGIYECSNAGGEQLGFDRCIDMITSSLSRDCCTIIPHKIYELIRDAGYTDRKDDFTFVTIKLQEGVRKFHTILFYQPTLANVATASDDCAARLAEAGFPERTVMQMKLLVSEFFSNIVRHGMSGNEREPVVIDIEVPESGGVTVTFRDSGKAWLLPEKAADADAFFDSLNEQGAVSGRGMQMIYAMASAYGRSRYHTINETFFTLAAQD